MAAAAPETELVTLREISRRLGVRYRAVQDARDAGAFPVYRLGKRWQRARWRDVETWWEGLRVQPGASNRNPAYCPR